MTDISVIEKIGALDAKVAAAHSRVDKLEIGIRDDLREIKGDVKDLNAHMNKGKGWAAAMMFLAGTMGGLVIKILSLIGR